MTEATKPAAKAPLTKEQKITAIQEQIAKLQQRLFNVENDIVEVKPAKVVALPEVGADVLFRYGRTTNTTKPVEKIGRVLAVKPAMPLEGGKTSPAQIKVQVGEGFDAELVTIYAGQLVNPGPATE